MRCEHRGRHVDLDALAARPRDPLAQLTACERFVGDHEYVTRAGATAVGMGLVRRIAQHRAAVRVVRAQVRNRRQHDGDCEDRDAHQRFCACADQYRNSDHRHTREHGPEGFLL